MVRKLMGLLLFVVVFWGLALAKEGRTPKFSVGILDTPVFAWVSTNEQGGVTSLMGFNLGLGIHYRSYFEPLLPEKGSVYWEAGTILLIDPYFGVGYDYRFNESVYAGAGVDILPLHFILGASYLGPYAAFFSIIPSIHVGFYLF